MRVFACVRLILVLVGKKNCACVRLILALVGGRQTAIVVVCTYYVPYTYVPGISRLPRDVYDTRYQVCITYQIRFNLISAGYPDTYVPGISRQTNVPPVDAHVWLQLHVSAVARCSDSYCILRNSPHWQLFRCVVFTTNTSTCSNTIFSHQSMTKYEVPNTIQVTETCATCCCNCIFRF